MRDYVVQIQMELLSMQDPAYRSFMVGLLPTVDPKRIIGVRTPQLRSYAKWLFGSDEAACFLKALPHRYYEEDNLHAFLLEQIKDFDELILALERFLTYIDNWSTCDSLSPQVFSLRLESLLPYIRNWLSHEQPYPVRFGIEMLMKHYLTDAYSPAYPEAVANIQREEYYIRMMQAWYFATALSVRFDELLPYVTEERLSPWVRQKTIQKAIESRRLTPEQKAFLRQLRQDREK